MHLTKNAVEGLQSIDPLTDLDAFLTLFYRLNNRECKLHRCIKLFYLKYFLQNILYHYFFIADKKEISLYSKLNVMYRDTQFHLMSEYFPSIKFMYDYGDFNNNEQKS